MADHTNQSAPYILYWNPFSICSLMVRYTLAIRGAARNTSDEMVVQECEVNIYAAEQLKETFLCDVNPEGQVPVLTHVTALAESIRDSLEITMYTAEQYPDLIPQSHKDEIARLLRDLHSINYFSLSFSGKQHIASTRLRDPILQLLGQSNISQRYRDALQFKLKVVEKDKVGGVELAQVEIEVQRAQSVLSKLEPLVLEGNGPWLYGRTRPTALDAHVVVFLARLRDVGRANLIPIGLEKYYERAIDTPEWQGVMEGRSTMTTIG